MSGDPEALAELLRAARPDVEPFDLTPDDLHALVVEVGRVTDSPGRRNANASAERQVAAEQLIYATPLVQKLMQDFGARVVPGSIRPL